MASSKRYRISHLCRILFLAALLGGQQVQVFGDDSSSKDESIETLKVRYRRLPQQDSTSSTKATLLHWQLMIAIYTGGKQLPAPTRNKTIPSYSAAQDGPQKVLHHPVRVFYRTIVRGIFCQTTINCDVCKSCCIESCETSFSRTQRCWLPILSTRYSY